MERVLVELRRIADVLERLAGERELVSPHTPLPKINLNLNSLNSSEELTKSLFSEKEGMQGEKKPKQKPMTAYPAGFKFDATSEMLAKGYGLDPHKELVAFRDFCTANNRLFKDWQAAFRTWLRNAVKFSQKGRS